MTTIAWKVRASHIGHALLGGGVVGLTAVRAPALLVLPVLLWMVIGLSFSSFTHRRPVFLIAIVWIFVQYFLTRTTGLIPPPGVWGDEACLGAICLGAFLTSLMHGHFPLQRVPAGRLLVGFVVLGVVSGYLNGLPKQYVILGIRNLVQPALYYLVLLHFAHDERFSRRVMKLLQVLVLVQCPLCMYQIWTWNDSLTYSKEDAAFGTFGFGTANMVGWLLMAFLFHFTFLFLARQMTWKRFVVVFGMLLVTWFLTSARVTLLFAGPLIGVCILQSGICLRQKIVFLLSSLLLGVVLLLTASQIFGSDLFPTDREGFEELLDNQLDKKSGGGRIYYFLDTQDVVSRYSPVPWFGLGPGGYSSYAGFTLKAPVLAERLGLAIDDPSTGYAPDVTAVSGEYGLFGLALWFFVFVTLWRRNERNLREIHDPFWRAVGQTGRILALIMIFAPLFTSAWQSPFLSATFWIVLGLVESHRRSVAVSPRG